MAKKNYDETAKQIMELVGGKDNVSFFTHCITRLRFQVRDRSLVKMDEIKAVKGVLGAQWSGEQFQVIIGNDVTDVYDTICRLENFEQKPAIDENLDEKKGTKKFSINTLFEILSGCMVPVLPALCAAGVIKGILVLLTNYLGMSTESGIYTLLNTVSDVGFYFMPFLVAYSAAKKFNTNPVMAILIAGLYLHPNISSLAGNDLNVLGVNMHILNYASTVFPMLISVWIMSYVYKFVDSHTPNALKFVLTPSLTLLIMAPICLGIIGPIGYYIGYYLATFVSNLFYLNPWIGGLVLGLIRPFVLLTGMQTTFTPIIMNNLTTLGYDFIWPVHSAFAMCCCGMSIGAYFRARKAKDEIADEKENFLSSFISGFAGVSEPALYGNAFRFKSQLVGLIISGAISGALVGGLGGKAVAAGNPPWLFLPTFGDTMGIMAICFVVAFVLSAVMAYIMGFGDIKFGKGGK